VVEVAQVEHLQVHAFGPDLGELAYLGGHLARRSGDADGPDVFRLPADRSGPAPKLGFVFPAAHRLGD
jgi:hypothetical protein